MEEFSIFKEEERRKEQERYLEERFSVLKTREHDLFTLKRLGHIADAFIQYLEEHHEKIITHGEAEGTPPPRVSWFSERLGFLYPDYPDSRMGFRVGPKVREGLLEIRILVLRELQRTARRFASHSDQAKAKDESRNFLMSLRGDSAGFESAWIEAVRSNLESRSLDPRYLLEIDRSYIRLNLFRNRPTGYTRIRSGGLTDLVEVMGRYVKLMGRLGPARVAETLDAAGLLGWDENHGAPWLKFKTFSRIPKYKHENLMQAVRQLAATESSERAHDPMYDIFVEMNAQQLKDWAEFDLLERLDPGKDDLMTLRGYWIRLNMTFFGQQSNLLFAPTESIWKSVATDFVDRNFMIQQKPGSTIWRMSFEGGPPFRVKNAGLKCIAYLLRHPDESIHYTTLGTILGSPDPRRQRKTAPTKPQSRQRLLQMRVRNGIFTASGAIAAIEEKCPGFASYIRAVIPDPKGRPGDQDEYYKYVGDKFSFMNVKFADNS